MNIDNLTQYMTGALAGVRVLDSTTMVAMPTGTHILGDMGAEIIKVETHTMFRTEAARLMYADNQPGKQPWNRDGSFNSLQRSKLGITLNLKTDEGKDAFKELVQISDILVENNRAGTMDRLGLGYEAMRQIRPDLIYVSNTGFGHTGPWKRYAGIGRMFELTCGLSHFTGYPDEGPRRVGKAFFDLHVGWMSVFAILAALQHRHETGNGQWLDFAMYQVGVSTMGDVILDFLINGRPGGLMGNSHPSRAPHGVYPCKGEDEWLAIDIQTEQQWSDLIRILGNPAWSKSDLFSSAITRKQNEQMLTTHINESTSSWYKKTLYHLLQKAGIPAAPVMNSRDVVTDPHLKERGFFEVVEHPLESGIGKRSYFGRPWKMSKTPAHIRLPAPMLGEHNEKIMRELLGRSQSEIDKLYEEHVMGKELLEPPTFTPPSYQNQLDDGSLAAVDPDYSKHMGIL